MKVIPQADPSTAPGLTDATRWWVLLAVALSSLCTGMVTTMFGPLIGDVAKDLHTDLGTASFGLLAMQVFVSAAGIGLMGFVIDRAGYFPVMLVGQALILLATAAIPAAGHSFGLLIFLRVLQGTGSACLTVAILPSLAAWFPRLEMGRAMGLQSVGMGIGIMLGLNLTPLLSVHMHGWSGGAGIMALIPLAVLAATLLIRRRAHGHAAAGRLAAGFPPVSDQMPASAFLRRPVFWWGLAALSACNWVGLTFNNLAPGFLAVDPPVGVGYGSQEAGGFMLLFTLTGIFGPPLGGFLVDKAFRGRSMPLIAIGWVLAAVCYTVILLPWLNRNPALLGLLLLLAGLSNPFLNVTLMSYAAKVFPPQVVGRVCGIWLSLSFLMGAAGLTVGSLALRATGSYALPLLIIGISSIIGLALTPFLKQPQREGAPEAGVSPIQP